MPKHSQDWALRWTGATGLYLSSGIVLKSVATGKSRWRWLVYLAGCEKRGVRASGIKSAYRCVRGNLCFLGAEWDHPLGSGKSTEMHFWDVFKLLHVVVTCHLRRGKWSWVQGKESAGSLHLIPPQGFVLLRIKAGLALCSSWYFISVSIWRNDTILSKIQRCLWWGCKTGIALLEIPYRNEAYTSIVGITWLPVSFLLPSLFPSLNTSANRDSYQRKLHYVHL